jgi:hypothetical protein
VGEKRKEKKMFVIMYCRGGEYKNRHNCCLIPAAHLQETSQSKSRRKTPFRVLQSRHGNLKVYGCYQAKKKKKTKNK